MIPKLWYSSYGTQVMILKLWYSSNDTQVMVLKLWYSSYGTQVSELSGTSYSTAPIKGAVAMAMLRLVSTIAVVRARLLGYSLAVTAKAITSRTPPDSP